MHKPQRQKKQTRTQILQLQVDALMANGGGKEALELMQLRSHLLTNGKQPPIPARLLNQRQKRKLRRQKA